jgi:hypothetical protein
VAGPCEHSNEPLGSIKGGEFYNFLMIIRFSGRTLLHGLVGWLVVWLCCYNRCRLSFECHACSYLKDFQL